MSNNIIRADLSVFCVFILLILLITMQGKNKRTSPREYLFSALIGVVLVMIFLDVLCTLVDGFPRLAALALIANTLYHLIQGFTPIVFLLYANYIVYGRLRKIYEEMRIWLAFIIISVAAPLINLAFPIFYFINAEGFYQRSSFMPFLYVSQYIPVVYTIIFLIRSRKRLDKREFWPLLLFPLPALIGSILQFLMPGLSLIYTGVCLSIVNLYTHLQSRQLAEDYLTGAFNRRRMDEHLAQKIYRSGQRNSSFSAIMIDIDNFKRINDKLGHGAGDSALVSSVRIFKNALRNMDFIARFAGDEFVIILDTDQPQRIEEIMLRIRTEADAFNSSGTQYYDLSFSMGAAVYDPKLDENADAFLKRIDEIMYKNKKNKRTIGFAAPSR